MKTAEEELFKTTKRPEGMVSIDEANGPKEEPKIPIKVIAIVLIALLVVFGGIATFSHVLNKQTEARSYEDIYVDVMDGHETENQFAYNGYVFARITEGGLWQTVAYKEDTPYELMTYYTPRGLADIEVTEYVLNLFRTQDNFIFVLDATLSENGDASKAGIAAVELGKIVGKRYDIMNKNITSAVSASDSLGVNVATCANVTDTQGIVFFTYADQTTVTELNNCILVAGPTGDEIIRASDAALFRLIGIMQ